MYRDYTYNYSSCNTLIIAAREVFLYFFESLLAHDMLYAAGVGLGRLVWDARTSERNFVI